jgi:predicted GH43/DUF377 family glycosyl hydrolase
MLKIIVNTLLLLNFVTNLEASIFELSDSPVVSTKKIYLKGFPGSHNPSLVCTANGLLLTFRYCPHINQPWISYIGILPMDNSFKPTSLPQILHTRKANDITPSQSEDARIFSLNNELYLIYNDNVEITSPNNQERRDMFLAKIERLGDNFLVSNPVKLYHPQNYFLQNWQKNWIPFEWNNTVLLSYTLAPHEVLIPRSVNKTFISEDLTNSSQILDEMHELPQVGEACEVLFSTQPSLKWEWGEIRGGTPAVLVGDKYLAFFHSSKLMASECTEGVPKHHYFMGAYTFSNMPPFEITHISPKPIVGNNFYTNSSASKRVIFPGGFVIIDDFIYVAYGKDDREVWIAKIDKYGLEKSLVSVQEFINIAKKLDD